MARARRDLLLDPFAFRLDGAQQRTIGALCRLRQELRNDSEMIRRSFQNRRKKLIDFAIGASDNKRRLAARDVSIAQGRGERSRAELIRKVETGRPNSRGPLHAHPDPLLAGPRKKTEMRSEIGRFERVYLQRHSRKALYGPKPGQ